MQLKYHKNAAAGRWFQFSLMEQMANIGSEVGRTLRWQEKNQENFRAAFERTLELFDLTLSDSRWRKGKRLREIGRLREFFCRAVEGDEEYKTSLQDIDRYLFPFAIAARKNI